MRSATSATLEQLSTQVNIQPSHFGVVPRFRSDAEPGAMEHKGVEYSVVQLTDDTGWRWEVRFDKGKSKSGTTRVSRALAIKLAETEIDRVLKDRK